MVIDEGTITVPAICTTHSQSHAFNVTGAQFQKIRSRTTHCI
jgi:hypothetical protein